MLSRVANSIYWMSRYLERADNTSRFVQVNSHLMLDLGVDKENSNWLSLIYTSGDQEDFNDRYKIANEKNALHFLTFDAKNGNSILSCIERARENARMIRENIPPEMWESINELYHLTKKHSRKRRIDDLHGFYDQIQNLYQLIIGHSEQLMVHGEAWHFARMGRMLERADKTARLIDIKCFLLTSKQGQSDPAYDTAAWGAVLNSVNAVDMYRKQHHLFNHRDIVDFLVFNLTVPRSVAFCVNAASESLKAIVRLDEACVPAQKEMEVLNESLRGVDIDEMLGSGLHEFIDRFQYNLNVVDESIFESFFAALK